VGDFNRDGHPDIAMSSAYDDFSGLTDPGALYVFATHGTGFTTVGTKVITQNAAGVPGSAESGDNFSLNHVYAGDFNGDGFTDVFVPVDGEDLGSTMAGFVTVLFGSA